RKARTTVSMLGEFKLAADPDFGGTNLVPEDFSLQQNYPNPFNPTTIIEYALPVDDFVELVIFNALGQAVKTLQQGRQLAGSYQVSWDGTDSRGHQVASGMFFYRIKAGTFVKTKKMILLR
ncbi:MAG: FlgD immunoglobulin-like domain containing protein, partial [bacterium]